MKWLYLRSSAQSVLPSVISFKLKSSPGRSHALALLMVGFVLAPASVPNRLRRCRTRPPPPRPALCQPTARSAALSSTLMKALFRTRMLFSPIRMERKSGLPPPVTMVHFPFADVAPGNYRSRSLRAGLETYISDTITMHPDEHYRLRGIGLPIASTNTSVTVTVTADQIATEQVHMQIQQRALGVFPNLLHQLHLEPGAA